MVEKCVKQMLGKVSLVLEKGPAVKAHARCGREVRQGDARQGSLGSREGFREMPGRVSLVLEKVPAVEAPLRRGRDVRQGDARQGVADF